MKFFFSGGSQPNSASSNILPTSSQCEETNDGVASNSSPPPPIATPLLEMGFTLKHILKAIAETKIREDVNVHTINTLATWMLEHPYLENTFDLNNAVTESDSMR